MSKTEIKTVKGLVQQMRLIRDKLNAELSEMTDEQRTAYFQKMREKSNILSKTSAE